MSGQPSRYVMPTRCGGITVSTTVTSPTVRCRLRSRVRAGMELPASDPVLTPLANAPAQEAQSPTESTEFVWEMTGGAPNPPFFFHTGLRHMAWKDFGGSHNKWFYQVEVLYHP